MILGENERLIRAYTLSENKTNNGKKHVGVYVTTKRLVHVVTDEVDGQTSERTLQCNVTDVRNIDYEKKCVTNAPMLILGIFFLLIGVNMASSFLMPRPGVRFWLVAVCAILIGVAFVNEGRKKKWRLSLRVFTCDALGREKSPRYKSDAVFCFEEKQKTVPADFDKLTNELPALILDINEMGEGVVEKWGQAQ